MNETVSTEQKRTRLNPLKGLGGQWIVDNTGFFLFLAVLAVVYIANGHVADKMLRDIDRTEDEIKQLQFEYKTVKREVMFRTEEAQLVKAVTPMGLEIPKEMPQRLQLEKTH